jgi:transposase
MTKGCALCVRLARLAHRHGASFASIGKLLGNLSRSAVCRRINNVKPSSKKSVAGIAKRVALRRRRDRIEAVIRDPRTFCKVASEVKKILHLPQSTRTILNDIKANGGKCYRMQRGPIPSPGDYANRKAWCAAQLKDPTYGTTSVFCDEKLFGLSQKGLKIEHVYRGQPRRNRAVGHTPYINMFAAIGPNGNLFLKRVPSPAELGQRHHRYVVAQPKANPHETRGRKRLRPDQKKQKARRGMDSEAFIDHILIPLQRVFRHKDFKLVVDNATPHVSKMTANWCKSKRMNIVRLSPRSPDINITENVWSALETAVWRRGVPKDLAELEKWVLDEGKRLKLSHLYDTVRPRTAEVHALGGKLLDDGWRKMENRSKKKHLHSLA